LPTEQPREKIFRSGLADDVPSLDEAGDNRTCAPADDGWAKTADGDRVRARHDTRRARRIALVYQSVGAT
jgi:hypothetical protein